MLANLYLSKQDLNKAVEMLTALAELSRNNYEHPFAIAQILHQAGRFEEALRYAEQALALTPETENSPYKLIALIASGG